MTTKVQYNYKSSILSLIIIGYILVGFTSCKKNDDPTPPSATTTTTTLLTFNSTGIPTTNSDDWICITDENGVVLDSKTYEGNQTITFTTTNTLPSQRINITNFRDSKSSTSEFITITTNLGVKINQSYDGFPPSTSSGSVANHNVGLTINNLPTGFFPYSFHLSTKSAISYGWNASYPGSSFTLTTTAITSITDPSLYLTIADNSGQPYYYEVPNLPNISTSTINFSSFKPTDHTISLNLPGLTGMYYSYNGLRNSENPPDNISAGYVNSYYLGNPIGTIKMGYNDGFDVYHINVSATFDKITKAYYKSGAAASSIPLLNGSLSLSNSAMDAFSFSYSGSYHQRASQWLSPITTVAGLQRIISWTIYSAPGGKQNITNVLSEMKKAFPAIPFDDLKYDSSVFTVYLDGYIFDDTWQLNVLGSTYGKPVLKEYQTIRFSN